jgi:origin recognition complex subunit 1
MSVLAVMRNLKSEVDAGSIRPYCFVDVNGLKLASPENIYRVKVFLRLSYSLLWLNPLVA